MKRNCKNYAMRRVSLAVDRVITKRGDVAKAKRWVKAWATLAGVKQSNTDA